MRTPLRTLLPASLCAAGLVFAHAPQACAQGSLTNDLVSDANPTDADLQRITDIATELCERLRTTDDPRVMERTRRDLLRPFTGFQTQSVAFRLRWGRAVAFELREVAGDEDVRRAVNALAALGPTGVPEAVAVLEEAIASERAAIRLAAAGALGDAIQTDTSVQILREPALRSLEIASGALKGENDPAVASALVSAMAVPPANTALLPRASALVVEALPDVVGDLPDGFDHLAWGKALVRAGATARAGSINATSNSTGGAATLRQATRAMTFSLAFVNRVLGEHDDPGMIADTPLEDVLESIVGTAFSQIQLATQRLGRAGTPSPDLTDALERAIDDGDASVFTDALDSLRPALDAIGVGDDALR
ncbi:MAG: hypothetical protein AAGH64_04955 [Planctomycetota bacterium]